MDYQTIRTTSKTNKDNQPRIQVRIKIMMNNIKEAIMKEEDMFPKEFTKIR